MMGMKFVMIMCIVSVVSATSLIGRLASRAVDTIMRRRRLTSPETLAREAALVEYATGNPFAVGLCFREDRTHLRTLVGERLRAHTTRRDEVGVCMAGGVTANDFSPGNEQVLLGKVGGKRDLAAELIAVARQCAVDAYARATGKRVDIIRALDAILTRPRTNLFIRSPSADNRVYLGMIVGIEEANRLMPGV